MRKNDVRNLHQKEESELKEMLKKERENLFSLNMDFSQGKLKNTSSLSNTRRDIARILTVLRKLQFQKESSKKEEVK